MTDTTITSTFYEKIASACRKKEALFDENLGRYALRSMFAGAYLTMSTAVGSCSRCYFTILTCLWTICFCFYF